MTTDISAVIEYAISYNEQLLLGDMHTITSWVNQGADPEKDIVPTMQILTAKYKYGKITSFRYFTRAVLEALQRRKDAEPKPVTPETIHARAKRIAWVRDKAPNIYQPHDLRWLEQYEAKHGRVTG